MIGAAQTWREWADIQTPQGDQIPWTFFKAGGEVVPVLLPPDGIAIFGGRPSHGKTAAQLTLAIDATMRYYDNAFKPPPVVYVTNDEAAPAIAKKIEVVSRFTELADDAIRILEADAEPVERVDGALREIMDAHGSARMVCWDFLQFFNSLEFEKMKGDRSDLCAREVMRAIRRCGKMLDCPQIVGSQMNRDSASVSLKRPGKDQSITTLRELIVAVSPRRTQLHHLRDGGAEQGADLVIGMQCVGGDIASGDNLSVYNTVQNEAQKIFIAEVLKDRYSHARGAIAVLAICQNEDGDSPIFVPAKDNYNPFNKKLDFDGDDDDDLV